MRKLSFLPGLFLLFTLYACHPYDRSQEPEVSLDQSGQELTIHWSNGKAWKVEVYKGAEQEDDLKREIVWDITADQYENLIPAPVSYGQAPVEAETRRGPEALVPGEPYTVRVERLDPKASGSGFTRKFHRYEDSFTFTAL